ncbi:hypothetical protein GCM10007216_01480 [Thalassobacillus devorans]|uniref:Uncharacterized protein n=1 Tax=Thalassobacillus devorans TaxID=279813 RepID=A0ABQ1NHT2_9BACI|nr:hypothetical protein [Thalassobacillus devorans]NIK27056.1 hypothetical protein [Thalassobacillus devorans]GGC74551.1 hypothetical protein GCM10007216_01480 [Thalassobacillus devorans]
MVYIIDSCFHWVGFHLVQHLLTEGKEVIGIDRVEDSKRENLYFYIGRNSRFQHFNSIQEMDRHCHQEHIEAAIRIEDSALDDEGEFGGMLLCESVETLMEGKGERLDLPPLYGEWMPRNESVVYIGKEPILFEELIQREDASYIEDFLARFLSDLTERGIAAVKEVYRMEKLADTSDREKIYSQLQNHYQRHQQFYED